MLQRKIRALSQEKNKVKIQLSSQKTGGIGGGPIDSSSSTNEIGRSIKKRNNDNKGQELRNFAKPFQQLVSHIKSRASKIRIED